MVVANAFYNCNDSSAFSASAAVGLIEVVIWY
jgi:hypothetical protein